MFSCMRKQSNAGMIIYVYMLCGGRRDVGKDVTAGW